jgi:hypothetical protein
MEKAKVRAILLETVDYEEQQWEADLKAEVRSSSFF